MKAFFKKVSVIAIAMALTLLMVASMIPMVSAAEASADHRTWDTVAGDKDLGETLTSMNVSLSGQITMMFYYTGLTDAHSYVKITVPQQDGSKKTSTFSKTDLYDEATGRYAVKVSLAAAQMTDLIELQWFNAQNESGKLRKYSVKYYADKIIELAAPGNKYESMVQPVKSMLNYGAMAQTIFGYNTNNLANKDLYTTESNPVNNMLADQFYDAEAGVIVDNAEAGIDFKGIQVFLQNTVSMRVYVDAPAGASATVDGQSVSIKSDENGSYVSIFNIPATKFARNFNIVVTSNGKSATATYSILGWCLDTVNNYRATADMKNLAKSLYMYYTWMTDYVDPDYEPGNKEEACTHSRSHIEGSTVFCSDCGTNISDKTVISLKSNKVELAVNEPTDVTFTISAAGAVDIKALVVTLIPSSDKITLTYKSGSAVYGDGNGNLQGEIGLNIVIDAGTSVTEAGVLATVTYTVTATEAGVYTITPVVFDATNSANKTTKDNYISSYVAIDVKKMTCDCETKTGYEADGNKHRFYCNDCQIVGEWEAHTEKWIVDAEAPQYETGICTVCNADLGRRMATANSDGLLLINPDVIKNYHSATNGDLMSENGMSFVRLHPQNTESASPEYILLHANKANPYTNVGGYIAILYRTTLDQHVLTACVSGSNAVVDNACVQWLPKTSCVDEWIFMVQPVKEHANYDKENLSTLALYPFTMARTAEDYTDVAFVSFFDSADDAWNYYNTYAASYNLTAQYYGNVNGNTNIDNTGLGTYTVSNKPVTINCINKVLIDATSLRFGGWFATPGGVQEFGYYVVDGENKSAYNYLTNGTNASSITSYIQNNYGGNGTTGINVAPNANGVKGAPVDLSAYEGKTVRVIAVARTNFGAEIELVHFTNVTVPCTHKNSTATWQIDTTDPQYETCTCSICGESSNRLATQTSEGTLLFNHQFINNKTSASNFTAEIKDDGPGGMSYIRFKPVVETGNKNVLLYADKANKIENLGEYIAVLYRTSVEQDIALILDSENNAVRGGTQKFGTTKSATGWRFAVNKVSANQYYNTTELSAAAFFPFMVNRTLTDYTDVAFIAFFSSEAKALEFFAMYQNAYSIPSSAEYYFNVNGNTKVDDSKFTGVLQANKPATLNCSDKTLSTTSSLKFGGWFATPEGIKEYGYYVIDSGNLSGYNKLLTASTSTSNAILTEVNKKLAWDINCTKGSVVGSPTPINLSAYAGKTVTVVVVAKTNLGAEIELVYFTNVAVPNQ